MIVPYPPVAQNGVLILTRHADGSVTHVWEGGRVIGVAPFLMPKFLGFDPRIGARFDLSPDVRLRILAYDFERHDYLCVPDDRRAHIEVVLTRVCRALHRAEVTTIRALIRLRILPVPDLGDTWQWRRARRTRP